MARFIAGVVAGMVITTLVGAAVGSHADEASAEVLEAATAAHVSPEDLQGALNSLKSAGLSQVDPYSYLRSTGELPPAMSGVWDRLVQCEASGNWHAATGNGYFGGTQQDMPFWRKYGGLAYAPRPDLATPAQQIVVAERGLAVQGWRAWPSCSRQLGLR